MRKKRGFKKKGGESHQDGQQEKKGQKAGNGVWLGKKKKKKVGQRRSRKTKKEGKRKKTTRFIDQTQGKEIKTSKNPRVTSKEGKWLRAVKRGGKRKGGRRVGGEPSPKGQGEGWRNNTGAIEKVFNGPRKGAFEKGISEKEWGGSFQKGNNQYQQGWGS